MDEIGVWLNWPKTQGAAEIALLGHSRGGKQTAWFAVEHTDSGFSRVFLIAPGGWDIDHEAEHYKERYGKDLEPMLRQARELVAAGKGSQLIQPIDFIYCEQTAAKLGYLDLPWVIVYGFTGSLIGDQLAFLLGRWRGRSILERQPRRQAPAPWSPIALSVRPTCGDYRAMRDSACNARCFAALAHALKFLMHWAIGVQ